ncbi:MAG: patatin-like protein [Chlorobium sp.]|nr:patatin-like protein [Chlorobium sp.]MCF8216381.1 patatin-like protein [Chlorobium sp.]MCF8271284.1 patatin-like protein [Chlorobium sp.]MCF8287658.1 patatin-like protein [Chlorobium sp.]
MAASFSSKSEIRFAVVMYGGVSLAIYMNGIAQELLRMVRATATQGQDNSPLVPYRELDRVEAVYRKIAYRLAGSKNEQELLESNAPLEKKFTIDVISGTSAGGINGIFLAKALAMGLKIDELKNLWIAEGDASLLINDKNSTKKTGLKLRKEPRSLFNSQRMYLKLLEAFEKMEQKKTDDSTGKPYVDELDLFVTATDILGLTLPVKLADSTVYERKHQTVFRFSCSRSGSTSWNDFVTDNNPMLAFAARSTSSFPFAFEPVMLSDIDEVLRKKRYKEEYFSDGTRWKRFFKNYPEKSPSGTVGYRSRSFGDGGYLDNKPFSYAIETISARHSDYPVQRKLLYIEPTPEHPESAPEKEDRPNAFENTIDALLKLPRYETIREDLEKIIERNRLTGRIERIIRNLDRDKNKAMWDPHYIAVYGNWKARKEKSVGSVFTEIEPLWAKPRLNDREWAMLDLADMTLRKGPGYVAYHRLEIEAVTDDFGRLLARVGGFDENSDTVFVFRNLLNAWREKMFVEYRGNGISSEEPPKTMNAFLHAFDLTFPLRRLQFLNRQIDRLYLMDDDALALDAEAWDDPPAAEEKRLWMKPFREELLLIRQTVMRMQVMLMDVGRRLRSRFRSGTDVAEEPSQVKPIHELVERLVKELASSPEILAVGTKSLRRDVAGANCAIGTSGDPENSFRHVIDYFLDNNRYGKSGFGNSESPDSRGVTEEQDSEARARNFLDRTPAILSLFDAIGDAVEVPMSIAIEKSDDVCRNVLRVNEDGGTGNFGQVSARLITGIYYRNYSDYDMVLFPILYGTGIGDVGRIDVSRISPEDATFLFDERACRMRKLAGTAFGSFGAFMEERWRRNDIMWGQLDGAERIIAALMPDREEAETFIGEAHAGIVLDTVQEMGRKEAKDLLVEAFMRPDSGKPEPDKVSRFIGTLRKYAGQVDSRGEESSGFPGDLDERALRDHYLAIFSANKRLEPESALKNAARATTVTGKILSGIADQYGVAGKRYLAFLTRIATFFWWLVEAAVPRTLASLLLEHWIKLLYLFEVLLLVVGYLFLNEAVQRLALLIAAITGALHLTLLWLRDLLLSRRSVPRILKNIAMVSLLLLLLFGIASVAAVTGMKHEWWELFDWLHDWLTMPKGAWSCAALLLSGVREVCSTAGSALVIVHR